jgi:hypothetical protein
LSPMFNNRATVNAAESAKESQNNPPFLAAWRFIRSIEFQSFPALPR